MNKAERMIMAALEAGIKSLAGFQGPAIADMVQDAMRRATAAIENMPDPAPATLGDQQGWTTIDAFLRSLHGGDYAREHETAIGGALRTIREWHDEANKAVALDNKLRDAEADFKNFHRLLCERFGYIHDNVNWRRDQLSLIEHIAKQVELVAQPEGVRLLRDGAIAAWRTVSALGYGYQGGEQWEPPLGTQPVFERPGELARFVKRMRTGGLRLDDFEDLIEPVTIDYTNHRGERALRNIKPLGIRFAANGNEYHPGPQWLLDAHDIDKDARRTFNMRDIHAWGGAAAMRAPEGKPSGVGGWLGLFPIDPVPAAGATVHYAYTGDEQAKVFAKYGANVKAYVSCPVCGEPNMQRDLDADGNALITCTNHECRSNGGGSDQRSQASKFDEHNASQASTWSALALISKSTAGLTVLRSDFDAKVKDLERAKALITEVYERASPHAGATFGSIRKIIEARTGGWFALGVNRDADPVEELAPELITHETLHRWHEGIREVMQAAGLKTHWVIGEVFRAWEAAGGTVPIVIPAPARDDHGELAPLLQRMSDKIEHTSRFGRRYIEVEMMDLVRLVGAASRWADVPRVIKSDTPPNQYVIEGAPAIDDKNRDMLREMDLLRWNDSTGVAHVMTHEFAASVLKRLYDEWPGGIDDMVETTRGLRRADARLGEFEKLLEDIGLQRERGTLGLTFGAGVEKWVTPLACSPGSTTAAKITTWFMRKQELLHGPVAAVKEPIPTDVYWEAEADNFYSSTTGRGMSNEFHSKWRNRADEFPTFFKDAAVNSEPAELGWIEWNGAHRPLSEGGGWPTCPVNRDAKIRVRFRDGEERQVDAPRLLRWAWTRSYKAGADIVAYQIIDDGTPF